MRTSDKGIAFLVAHEGIVPAPYLDAVGVWTYGIGHTASAGAPRPVDMPRGMPRDVDGELRRVFEVFQRDLTKFEARVNAALAGRKVAQHEFDAAVSFDFNTGRIHNANWVGIWRNGAKAQAADNMVANWRKPSAIIPRREAEAELLRSGNYGTKSAAVWSVSSSGRIDWSSPVRTLTQEQVLALMPGTSEKPTDADTRPQPKPPASAANAPGVGTAAIIAIAVAAIAAYLAGVF